MALRSSCCCSCSFSLLASRRTSPPAARASRMITVRPKSMKLPRDCSAFRCCSPSGSAKEAGRTSICDWVQIENLLKRKWLMQQPSTRISRILLSKFYVKRFELGESDALGNLRFSLADVALADPDIGYSQDCPMFYVIRDDLLHPLLGGNKLRKLDALIPQLEDCNVTDVLLLVQSEGLQLICYYGGRSPKFRQGRSGTICSVDELKDCHTVGHTSKKVAIVKEGAGDSMALLGLIRLVHHLSHPSVLGGDRRFHFVVDTGTGTTATGLALGMWLLKLPWRVTGVMLADTAEGYELHKTQLLSTFCDRFSFSTPGTSDLPLTWEERSRPRRFGVIFPGEVRACQTIARQTGILLDPIYTLAGWEAASRVSLESDGGSQGLENVVMLHTGGTLGLFGLAQRYPSEFT